MRVNWQNDSLAQFTDIPAFASTGIWTALPELQRANTRRVAQCPVIAGEKAKPLVLAGPTWSWPQVCAVAFLVTEIPTVFDPR
jgi:hypothetical protein